MTNPNRESKNYKYLFLSHERTVAVKIRQNSNILELLHLVAALHSHLALPAEIPAARSRFDATSEACESTWSQHVTTANLTSQQRPMPEKWEALPSPRAAQQRRQSHPFLDEKPKERPMESAQTHLVILVPKARLGHFDARVQVLNKS